MVVDRRDNLAYVLFTPSRALSAVLSRRFENESSAKADTITYWSVASLGLRL